MTHQERKDIRNRFLHVSTSVICDVFDELELEATALAPSLARRTTGANRLAGWASTIAGAASRASGPDRLKLQVVDSLPPDSVSVWSGTDAGNHCLFGDLIAATMQNRGCHGAVVDGGFRDVSDISATGFPVFARFTSPVQSIGRWRVTGHGMPVVLPGALEAPVTVNQDDFIIGDDDGVVVIHQHLVARILERAEAIVSAEAEARRLGADGMTASEMLEKYGHV